VKILPPPAAKLVAAMAIMTTSRYVDLKLSVTIVINLGVIIDWR
jgi:hypothetical protein